MHLRWLTHLLMNVKVITGMLHLLAEAELVEHRFIQMNFAGLSYLDYIAKCVLMEGFGDNMIGAVDRVDDIRVNRDLYVGALFYDDISGKPLPKELTVKARGKDMEQVYAHRRYDKVPFQECYDVTGNAPVGTEWLEVNKGDEGDYRIRARLVAQEFTKGKLEALFAAAPPLEAKKALLSLAVAEGIGYGDGLHYKIYFIDIKRAYFYAPAKRDVYVRLPMEDFDEGKCGKLNKSMYGTRDASLNLENEYVRFMTSI